MSTDAKTRFWGFALLPLLLATGVSFADDDDEIKIPGKLEIDLRYRWETVRDDSPMFLQDAQASTFRTSIAYTTPGLGGLRGRVRFEDVSNIGYANDHFNAGAGDLSNGVTGRPTIADPEITDVLEAALDYRVGGIVRVEAGRALLSLGEDRFVGAVPWRQHWQSFDLARVDVEVIPRTRLTFAWLDRVHRIFGDSLGMDSNLFNAGVDAGPVGEVTLYRYDLDYDEMTFAGLSTETTGLRVAGSTEVADDLDLNWHAEYAEQDDSGDNPASVDADYLRLQVGAQARHLGGRVGLERLGGSVDDGAFSTPLATLHKWNGFADLFLNTPADGLEDTYLTLTWKGRRMTCLLTYHEFESDTAGLEYGNEVDAQVVWKSWWNQTFALKYARYEADQFAADRDVFWFWTSYRWDSSK